MDYLLSQGYRVDPEASIAVDNAVSKPVFNEFRKRVAEEYASKTVRSLQASVRFTEEEVQAQPPITGEVDAELLRALTTQVPQTADAKDIILITDEQEATDDSRKRPRSEAATPEPVLQPKPKLASTQPKFASFVSSTDQASSAAASSSSSEQNGRKCEKGIPLWKQSDKRSFPGNCIHLWGQKYQQEFQISQLIFQPLMPCLLYSCMLLLFT